MVSSEDPVNKWSVSSFQFHEGFLLNKGEERQRGLFEVSIGEKQYFRKKNPLTNGILIALHMIILYPLMTRIVNLIHPTQYCVMPTG